MFDDDIQGTGAVVLAGVIASRRITGVPLREQRFLFLGAGEAAIGISNLFVAALIEDGMTPAQARSHCWLFDSHGLVVKSRTDLAPFKKTYAHDHRFTESFLEASKVLKPSEIIGASGAPNTFTRPVIRALAAFNKRPLVFALSNPTSKAECTARQACEWSGGRAVFASGSPFEPFDYLPVCVHWERIGVPVSM